METPMTYALAHKVWLTLVRCGATPDGGHTSREFVQNLMVDKPHTEWRFMGNLGSGGKFWRCHERWYVNCYPENETPELREVMKKTNLALAELRDRCGTCGVCNCTAELEEGSIIPAHGTEEASCSGSGKAAAYRFEITAGAGLRLIQDITGINLAEAAERHGNQEAAADIRKNLK
jgi:hypothetical protein